MKNTKQEIRNIIKNRRSKLLPKEVIKKSEAIINKVKTKILDGNFEIISVYYSTENEVQTQELIKWLFSIGKRVVIPFMDSDHNMEMKEIDSFDFKREVFLGIIQPIQEYKSIDIKKIDLTITPCLGFDKKHNRLGYGLGCYDKMLRETNSMSWLLAFDVQEFGEIPTEECDEEIDIIFTETR
ncbi:5-formyltetrahydrofolate cyclo-ligase [Mycoplasma marinum]|nr:5-formyltetrahydrofolate cyclo-ligase [Mycoplasma marinum]